jgi:hypothetical protein
MADLYYHEIETIKSKIGDAMDPKDALEYVKRTGEDAVLMGLFVALNGSGEDICSYAEQVEGAPLRELTRALVDNHSSIDNIVRFSKSVSGAEADTLVCELMLGCADSREWEMLLEAKNPITIERAQGLVMRFGNVSDMIAILPFVSDEKVLSDIHKTIVAEGDIYSFYDAAKHIPGTDINDMLDRIFKIGETLPQDEPGGADKDDLVDCLTEFARNIPGADIDRIQEYILENGDSLSACTMACDVEDTDVEALYQKAKEQGFESLPDHKKAQFESRYKEFMAEQEGPRM